MLLLTSNKQCQAPKANIISQQECKPAAGPLKYTIMTTEQ